MRSLPLSALSSVVLVTAALAAPQGVGSFERISARMPRVPGGLVREMRFAPDGSRIVFCADVETLGEFELYVVPSDGSTGAVRLSDDLPTRGSVESFAISSDSERVVFLADQAANDVIELWSVPLDGSAAPVRLNGALAEKVDVRNDYQVSPDGTRVFFRTLLPDDRSFVWSVPIAGGTPVLLTDSVTVFGGGGFRISADSTRVVYRADSIVANRQELFSVPIDGSASAVRLNGPLVGGGDVQNDYVVGTTRVFYRADELVDEQFELFGVPVDGSAPAVRLGGSLPPNGDVLSALVSPDESRVVFRANPAAPRVELFSVLADGSEERIALGPGSASGGDASGDIAISPDGSRVVYRGDTVPNGGVFGDVELYSVPIAGGPEVKLNAALVAGELVHPDFEISADGSTVAFLAGAPTSVSLFARAIDASAPPIVLDGSGLLVASSELTIGADGERVCYGVPGLRSVPLDGSAAPVEFSAASAIDFAVGPDASFTAYRVASDPDFPSVVALFSRATDGSSAAHVLSPPFLAIDTVAGVVAWLPMEGGAVYVAPVDTTGTYGIFHAPVPAGGEIVRVNGAVPIDGGTPLTLASGGTRVLFFGGTESTRELYSAPIDGSAEPIVLNAPLVTDGSVIDFLVSGDGSKVLYRADQDEDQVFELYWTRADVEAAPLKINGALVAGGDVQEGYRCGPNGLRVIYLADQDADNRIELFGRAGLNPPVRLHPPLGPSGSIREGGVELSPDGTRAFYVADLEVDERFDLYSVPSNGSAAPIRVDDTGANGDVYPTILVTPDGSRVLFAFDWPGSGGMSLYTTPADGSAPSARLDPTGAIPSVAGFDSVMITPGGEHVLFRYAGSPGAPGRLYSAPVDASAPAVYLSEVLGPLGNVEPFSSGGEPTFLATPDDSRAVFMAEHGTGSEPIALYSVPIDGSSGAIALSDVDVSYDVEHLRIDSQGDSVVFLQGGRLLSVPVDGTRRPLQVSPPAESATFVPSDFDFLPGESTVLYKFNPVYTADWELFAGTPGVLARPATAPDALGEVRR